MKYSDGSTIMVGDKVRLWEGCEGVVVCSVDTGQYSSNYPKIEWEYLRSGVLFETDKAGLVHYLHSNEDLELIKRAAL